MKTLRFLVFAAAAGWLLAAGPAVQAQTGQPAADGPAAIEIYTDADASAVLNARIAALKTVLELTPDQQKLWPSVEASIRKIAADAMARGKQRSEAPAAKDFLDVLERVGDAEATRAADLKVFVAAARPLVAALNDAQRNRVPAFLGMAISATTPLSTQSLWLFEEEER
jgi:hypothetical protein